MVEKQKQEEKVNPTAKRKRNGNQTQKLVFLFLMLFVGLYLGVAGWTRLYYEALSEQAMIAQSKVDCNDPSVGVNYEGVVYCTSEDYFAAQQEQLMENAGFYWIFSLPDPLHILLSAFAFGVVGILIRLVGMFGSQKKLPDFQSLITLSTTGGMIAILLLGVYYIFPDALPGALKVKPVLQPFLSLFAGAYSEHIQDMLQSLISKFFTIGKEKP